MPYYGRFCQFYAKSCLYPVFHAAFLSNILLTLALDTCIWVKYMENWKKYVAAGIVIGTIYFLPSESFAAFIAGWVFLIPLMAVVFLAVGLREYMSDRKNRIMVSINANEAMKALARREAELKREKELLYEQFGKA